MNTMNVMFVCSADKYGGMAIVVTKHDQTCVPPPGQMVTLDRVYYKVLSQYWDYDVKTVTVRLERV